MSPFRRSAAVLCLLLMGSGVTGGLLWYGRPHTPVQELVAAIGAQLTIEPRLTGGFMPPRRPSLRRTTGARPAQMSPEVRIAVARIEKAAAQFDDPRTQAAFGVALLVEGEVDRSIGVLEQVVSARQDAPALSDLSAAYLVKAQQTPARRLEFLVRGFDAASRSVRLRPSNEARFNRALAAEGLAPYVRDARPWNDYLNIEQDSRWLTLARERADRAALPQEVRGQWEERRRLLRGRVSAVDREFLDASAAAFPEALLDFLDQELLVDWARAELSADRGSANRTLAAARRAAEAVSRVTGDPMPVEEIALITSSAARGSGDPRTRVLARAHLAYAQGQKQYDADDYRAADASFDDASSLFTTAGSPYRGWAETQLATILFQRRDLEAADRRLAEVERAARAQSHTTLLGRTAWLRGLVYSKLWRLPDAFDAFRVAASSFEAASEQEYAVTMYSYLADALRTLGEYRRSWEYIGKTLEGMGRVRRTTRRYLFLYNASLFASSQGLLDGALVFEEAALREAESGVTPFIVAEALVERGMLRNRSGDLDSAKQDADAALKQIDRIPIGPERKYAEAEAELLLAELARVRRGPPRIDGIRRAIDFFTAAEPARVPRLFLALASAHAAGGDVASAERALVDGIEQLERRQSGLGDEALKISYFDEGWNLFPEMIALQLSRSRQEQAFDFAERSRARLLAAAIAGADQGPLTLDRLRRALPESTAMLYYATLDDRLLVWTVARGEATLVEQRISRQQLERLVARHVDWLAEERGGSSPTNDALFDALVRPALRTAPEKATLVVVGDGALQRLPFATLRRPDTGRYLVEDRAIVAAPSATLFLAGLDRVRRFGALERLSALLVGNPHVDAVSSDLPRLPGADQEATTAARFYANSEVLTGRTATRRRFTDEAPRHDVVHFGGHAFVNAEYPLLSRLIFASGPDGAPEPLFAHEISRLVFVRTRVVVLAACSTAAGAISRGEGVVSVARPFLAAGVPVVIASQWNVEDRATERLFVEFHRALSTMRDPVEALRAAQLSLLHGTDTTLASPGSWGGFVALGTTGR